jgi:hypothetical protein
MYMCPLGTAVYSVTIINSIGTETLNRPADGEILILGFQKENARRTAVINFGGHTPISKASVILEINLEHQWD